MSSHNEEELLKKLRNITPSKSAHLPTKFFYFPVKLVLINGTVKEWSVIIDKSNSRYFFKDVFGDSIKEGIKWEEVSDIIEYSDRIPTEIVQKINNIGETSMGGVEFKLIMYDTGKFLYNIPIGTPGIVDFLKLPEGYSVNDIKDVIAAPREFNPIKTDLILDPDDLNWCVIEDILISKVIDKNPEYIKQKGTFATLKQRFQRKHA